MFSDFGAFLQFIRAILVIVADYSVLLLSIISLVLVQRCKTLVVVWYFI